MHFKIDIQLRPIPNGIHVDAATALLKDKFAYELGKYILDNSDFITDKDLRSERIQKDCLFFPDPEHFHRVLNSPAKGELLTQDFK